MSIPEQGSETAGSAFRAGPPKERTTLRNNLEYFAVLILVVLLLRQVVVEAFRIQHGSMAPTLVSTHQEIRCPNCGWFFDVGADKAGAEGDIECPNCHYHWAGASEFDDAGLPIMFRQPDWIWNSARERNGTPLPTTDAANRIYRGATRIFVNKFIYGLRQPRRWEVVVFLYPFYSVQCRDCGWRAEEVESIKDLLCPVCGSSDLEITTKNYIKRLTGLPGERIALKDGDVYANGVLQRKPPEVQDRMWFHVFDSEYYPRKEVEPIWDLGGRPDRWVKDAARGTLVVDAQGISEPVLAAYGRHITDFYAYDGLSYEVSPRSIGAAGRYEVGDCRICARVRPVSVDPTGGTVILQIDDAGHQFTLSVDVGDRANAVLQQDGVPVRQARVKGPVPGDSEWIVLENYDDRVVCKVDGREVMRYEYEGGTEARRGIHFGARGATVRWDRIVIQRDMYYENAAGRAGAPPSYDLGKDGYFMLGDNSPVSMDSRNWKKPGVPAGNLIGRAFFVFWPVHQMKWLGSGQAEPAAASGG